MKTNTGYPFLNVENGRLIYLPTGEDVTAFADSSFAYYGAAHGLRRLVNEDPLRIPDRGWRGDIHELARITRLDPELVAEQFGYSLQAFEDCEVIFNRT